MGETGISVVLPVYNGQHYLSEAVASITAQTFAEWELIIVDDASTDMTPEMVSALCATDPRIRCIRHASNKRLPAALNTGFAAARNEFLTWTSCDNAYRADAFQEMVSLLSDDRFIDLVYSDYSTIDEDGKVTGCGEVLPPDELAFRNCIGACFLFRRQVYKQLKGYDEARFLTEDYDFWLRAAAQFTLKPLHKDLYLYRHHGGSLTETRRAEIIRATDDLLECRIPELKFIARSRRASALLEVAERRRVRGETEAAKRAFGRALSMSAATTLRDPRSAPLVALRWGYQIARVLGLLSRAVPAPEPKG